QRDRTLFAPREYRRPAEARPLRRRARRHRQDLDRARPAALPRRHRQGQEPPPPAQVRRRHHQGPEVRHAHHPGRAAARPEDCRQARVGYIPPRPDPGERRAQRVVEVARRRETAQRDRTLFAPREYRRPAEARPLRHRARRHRPDLDRARPPPPRPPPRPGPGARPPSGGATVRVRSPLSPPKSGAVTTRAPRSPTLTTPEAPPLVPRIVVRP